MIEILKVSKRINRYLHYRSAEEESLKKSWHAIYHNHEGKLIGHHWLQSKEDLDQTFPGWEAYLKRG